MVAAVTTEWVRPVPPPVVAIACCDLLVPEPLLMFSGSELRSFNSGSSPDQALPPLSFALKPGPIVLQDVEGITDHDSYDAVLGQIPADYFIAHGATSLRALLPREFRHGNWICSQRIAQQAWPDAPGLDLRDVTAWRGIHPSDGIHGQHRLTSVTESAVLTALLLIELLERKSVYVMHVISTNFITPPAPPDLGDDIAWAQIPDDDLTWLSRTGTVADQPIRDRAELETERRQEGGWETPLLGQPPIYTDE